MAAALPAHVTVALLALAAVAAAQSGIVGSNDLFPASNRGLRPQRLVTFGITHYYQLAENPIGTVAFFHGCARSARNFFPFDPQYCPECTGLPEHLSHTKQALARGYNVLAMDPLDTRFLCWSSTENNGFQNDQPRAISTLRYFLLTNNLASLPVYLWGASSGGTLALKMVNQLYQNHQAVTAMAASNGAEVPYTLWGTVRGVIAEASTPTSFNAEDSQGRLSLPSFPPTIFVRMQRDRAEADVEQNLAFFSRNGVPSDVIISPVRRITATYFSDRTPMITQEQSARVVDALKQIGLLGDDGYLLANPHDYDNPKSLAYKWPSRLQSLLPWLSPTSKSLNLVLRTSPIFMSLMVSYAQHDAVSDYFTACLAWLEQRGQTSATTLARQLTVPNFNLSALTADRKYVARTRRG